jgi:hypothetical protein
VKHVSRTLEGVSRPICLYGGPSSVFKKKESKAPQLQKNKGHPPSPLLYTVPHPLTPTLLILPTLQKKKIKSQGRGMIHPILFCLLFTWVECECCCPCLPIPCVPFLYSFLFCFLLLFNLAFFVVISGFLSAACSNSRGAPSMVSCVHPHMHT